MLRGLEMLARMLVLRVIAAAHVPAASAQPQVYPRVTEFEALLTAMGAMARVGCLDGTQMSALRAHVTSLLFET
jgi:hypothetical protein